LRGEYKKRNTPGQGENRKGLGVRVSAGGNEPLSNFDLDNHININTIMKSVNLSEHRGHPFSLKTEI
jgi:hypothetical protein